MSRKSSIGIIDTNGTTHECIAEAFKTPYQVFILIQEVDTLKRRSFLIGI
jgi:hypothetical protein